MIFCQILLLRSEVNSSGIDRKPLCDHGLTLSSPSQQSDDKRIGANSCHQAFTGGILRVGQGNGHATVAGSHSQTAEMLGGSEAGGSLERRAAMALYAQAKLGELQSGLDAQGAEGHGAIREPETGLVMVRGRIGGDGAPFNFGEATVTRAAVRIASGEIGFSYLLGRDREKVRLAALYDALWQNAASRGFVEERVLAPVRARVAAEREATRARTEATRVGFFTLVRGEDAA